MAFSHFLPRARHVIASELFDTHCHIFESGYYGQRGVPLVDGASEIEAYEQLRARHSVVHSLVVGFEGDEQYRGNNRYIANLAVERSWMTPLRFIASRDRIARGEAVSIYARGVDSAQSAAQVLEAAHAGAVAPSMVSLNVVPEALDVLVPTVRRLSQTWFLISHLGLPGPVTSMSMARERLAPVLSLAGCANVSVKLSGQYAASAGGYPHIDVALVIDALADALGVASLVWGSDFSPCLDHVSFDQAVECLLPQGASSHEQASIFFGNARRNFDLYCGAAA